MLAIGLCDDNYDARLALRAALERHLESQGQRARLLEFSSGEGLLGWLDKHPGELNLIFLDMEMGDLNGMDTARQLRKRDETLPLVFVTGYPDHVFEGYQVGALAYLLKPPTPQQLEDVLTRAAAALLRSEDQVYLCRRGEITYRIPRKDILYFTSDRRQVTCVTKDAVYAFYGKLDQVAQELGDTFVRIHQRYLVKVQAVDKVAGNQVFLGDTVLPISRSCHAGAMIALTRAALEE